MSGLSKQEMRRQIKRINRIDLSKSNYETVKAIINKMIEGIPIQVSASLPQDLLFRARKNPGGKITDVSGLCAPDYGDRCNNPQTHRHSLRQPQFLPRMDIRNTSTAASIR